jgi:hypothetical protein
VPISEEISDVILAQIHLMKENSTANNNPNNYLFCRLTGRRKGRPISQGVYIENLNNVSVKAKILECNGKVYWFRNHAFRHRYGVNLINNGMSACSKINGSCKPRNDTSICANS